MTTIYGADSINATSNNTAMQSSFVSSANSPAISIGNSTPTVSVYSTYPSSIATNLDCCAGTTTIVGTAMNNINNSNNSALLMKHHVDPSPAIGDMTPASTRGSTPTPAAGATTTTISAARLTAAPTTSDVATGMTAAAPLKRYSSPNGRNPILVANVSSYDAIPTPASGYQNSSSAPSSCQRVVTYRGVQSYGAYSCPTTHPSRCYVPPTSSMIPAGQYRRFCFRGQLQLANPYTHYPLPASMMATAEGGSSTNATTASSSSLTALPSLPTTSKSAGSVPVYGCCSQIATVGEKKVVGDPIMVCPTADRTLKQFVAQSAVAPTQALSSTNVIVAPWSNASSAYTNNSAASSSWYVSRRCLDDARIQ